MPPKTFLSIILGLGTNPLVMAQGGFIGSCHDLTLNSAGGLSAWCTTNDGLNAEYKSALDLGAVIGESNGFLQWKSEGHFADDCDVATMRIISTTRMGGYCKDDNLGLQYSEIDLNEQIGNSHGLMEALGRKATKVDQTAICFNCP